MPFPCSACLLGRMPAPDVGLNCWGTLHHNPGSLGAHVDVFIECMVFPAAHTSLPPSSQGALILVAFCTLHTVHSAHCSTHCNPYLGRLPGSSSRTAFKFFCSVPPVCLHNGEHIEHTYLQQHPKARCCRHGPHPKNGPGALYLCAHDGSESSPSQPHCLGICKSDFHHA